MKKQFLFLTFLLITLLFQSCKRDDEELTEDIYGKWENHERRPFYLPGGDRITYSFRKPNYCKYVFEPSDYYAKTTDSLTFVISDRYLNIYQKDGSYFRRFYIEKLGNVLKLTDDRNTVKYKRVG